MITKRTSGAVLAFALSAAAAFAHDPWESGEPNDDTAATRNTLDAGAVQQHDLDQGGWVTQDRDWAITPTLEFHSYEARVSGGNVVFGSAAACSSCATFQRIDQSGTVTDSSSSTGTLQTADRVLRWIAAADRTNEHVRVTGGSVLAEDEHNVYTLRYSDTTYTLPRWNAAGGQTTVLVLTSLAPETVAVTANVYFFFNTGASGGPGALLHTESVVLRPNLPVVLSTASMPTLAGRSGFALVAHTAGYGGLTGKAVALEPSTGFTFDTALQAIPQ